MILALATDLSFYSTTSYFESLSSILLDLAANITMALSGISIGFVYSKISD